jgi:hypothetical protein
VLSLVLFSYQLLDLSFYINNIYIYIYIYILQGWIFFLQISFLHQLVTHSFFLSFFASYE